VQFRHIIIVLGLVESSGDGIAQLMFLGELGGAEFGPILS